MSLPHRSHLLGGKLREIRRRNGLTLEELSARCVQRDAQHAPSVSYLSMIERGKRAPSPEVLALLGAVFQRPAGWFLDESAELAALPGAPIAGAARVPLEPSFLFSGSVLQAAIPELLSQTGMSGRQFAHLLIRTHQEMSHNDFPELEWAAESVGGRQFPLSAPDLLGLAKRHGLSLRWFEEQPVLVRDGDREVRSLMRSFFEAPDTIYANKALLSDPARLRFDLAAHIGHKLLHGGDGLKSPHATGGEMGGSPEGPPGTAAMSAHDVLLAWRDFECSFFAGALLAPRIPFRRFLAREHHRVEASTKLELTPAVVMRRMTKVSPYPYWHFFDAYPPGHLRAVYRGNGIPLPWGNLARLSDPCPGWTVFRMLADKRGAPCSQISVLRDGGRSLLYCCHSRRVHDMAGNPHVLSVGVDLAPALDANGVDSIGLISALHDECFRRGAEAAIPNTVRQALAAVAQVLDIAWIEDALGGSARIICPVSARCPCAPRCEGARPSRAREIRDVRTEILRRAEAAPQPPGDNQPPSPDSSPPRGLR
jgi:transcriptional regulator with XRE-family HTH domain